MVYGVIRLGLHSYCVGKSYFYLNNTDSIKMQNNVENSNVEFKTAGKMLIKMPTVQASQFLLCNCNSLHMFCLIKSCLL